MKFYLQYKHFLIAEKTFQIVIWKILEYFFINLIVFIKTFFIKLATSTAAPLVVKLGDTNWGVAHDNYLNTMRKQAIQTFCLLCDYSIAVIFISKVEHAVIVIIVSAHLAQIWVVWKKREKYNDISLNWHVCKAVYQTISLITIADINWFSASLNQSYNMPWNYINCSHFAAYYYGKLYFKFTHIIQGCFTCTGAILHPSATEATSKDIGK